MIDGIIFNRLSGMNRQQRRKYFKEHKKEIGVTWEELNSNPNLVKREPYKKPLGE